MNAGPIPCLDRLRRGRASRAALVALASAGLLLLAVLAAWWAGWLSRGTPGAAAGTAARQPPAAELKLDIATPLDGAADASWSASLAAAAAAGGAKAGALDDDARFAALRPRDSWADPRQAAGEPGPPRRWEIRFLPGNTKERYARLLDFFGIELAVVMPDNKLVYVSGFSKKQPDTRTAAADAERRCYLAWREGELAHLDLDLLASAGVNAIGRVVLKVLPPAVEDKLADLEKAAAGDDPDAVFKTCFGVRDAGERFEFYVIEQYRKERARP